MSGSREWFDAARERACADAALGTRERLDAASEQLLGSGLVEKASEGSSEALRAVYLLVADSLLRSEASDELGAAQALVAWRLLAVAGARSQAAALDALGLAFRVGRPDNLDVAEALHVAVYAGWRYYDCGESWTEAEETAAEWSGVPQTTVNRYRQRYQHGEIEALRLAGLLDTAANGSQAECLRLVSSLRLQLETPDH